MNTDEEFTPISGYQRLRVVSTATARTAARDVLEMASVDLLVGDAGCHVGLPRLERFSPRSDDPLPGRVPPCTPAVLGRAVWSPMRPDALVAHDVALERVVLTAAITGPLPWIGLGRVARRIWPDAPGYLLGALTGWLGHVFETAPPAAEAARTTGLTALLLMHMLQSPRERARLRHAGRRTEPLHPLVGDMLGDPVVQAMLDLSAASTQPLREAPDPWDEEDWLRLPAEDLWWFAKHERPEGGVKWAVAELERRHRDGEPGQPASQPPPVLLRHVGPLPRR